MKEINRVLSLSTAAVVDQSLKETVTVIRGAKLDGMRPRGHLFALR